MNELINNVVLHTDGSGELCVWLPTDERPLRIEVHDSDTREPIGALENHHHGLFIVGRVADSWGWQPTAEGKFVWAELC